MNDTIEHLKILQDTAAVLRRFAAKEYAKIGREILRAAKEIEADADALEMRLTKAGRPRLRPAAKTRYSSISV